MEIKVDDREEELIKVFKLLEIPFKTEHLLIGDITNDIVVIERKTVNDFVNSMIDGRLGEQIEQMQNYEKSVIIIEGSWNELTSEINKHSLLGMMASIISRTNTSIIQVRDSYETCILSYKLCLKSNDGKIFNHHNKKKKELDVSLSVLCLIPKINEITAKKILEKYKLKDLLIIGEERLKEIDGIGNKLAGNMVEFFKNFN